MWVNPRFGIVSSGNCFRSDGHPGQGSLRTSSFGVLEELLPVGLRNLFGRFTPMGGFSQAGLIPGLASHRDGIASDQMVTRG